MYELGALEFERPFLGPLYILLTLHPRGAIRRVPSHVAFILRYSARQVEVGTNSAQSTNSQQSAHRGLTRRRATREPGRVAGCLYMTKQEGSAQPARRGSAWRSRATCCPGCMRKETSWPWLEALAVVVPLRAFYEKEVLDGRNRATVAATWTDNRGNWAALNKLMCTHFLASAVHMELFF